MRLASLLLCLLISFGLFGAEIDSFTHRYRPLEDSSEIVNEKTNEMLQIALENANERHSCSERRLYKHMRKFFRNHMQGELTNFVLHSENVDKRLVDFDKSVYAGISFWESPVLRGTNRFLESAIGKIVRMGDHLIGTDKFEHFFGRGYAYFKKHYKKNDSIKDVLEYGIFTEKYYLGALTTGVMSYADLAANFNGMRFWNHVLGKNPDILGEDLGPYVDCIDGRWVQVKKIDWLKYIDLSWDEGNNCSSIRRKSMLVKIQENIQKLEKNDKEDRPYGCPIDREGITNLANEKYSVFGEYFINAEGMDFLKDK